MKKYIITLLLSLLFVPGYAQNFRNEYKGRLIPSVKKGKLNEAYFISDIAPQLWSNLVLPYKERADLELRRKTQGYYNANTMIDYVSVDISTLSNGTELTARSTGDRLTTEQKNMLKTVDPGSWISMKIRFSYKIQANDNLDTGGRIVEGTLAVAVVPETEAEYPGGFEQLTADLIKNVRSKVAEPGGSEKIQQAIVKFTINEKGRPVDVKIFRTSTDPRIDQLLQEAIHQMPGWKPAENAKGVKVKQEFTIPLGRGGC